MQDITANPLDVSSILNSIPGNHLILLPDAPRFTIAGATDAYVKSTYIKREEVIGQGVFESLTDDPQNPEATGVKNLSASLHYVLEHKREHRMADQRYDVLNPKTGQFELKVWSPLNKPVLDGKGNVQYIIHTVEDVTEKVLNRQRIEEGRQELQLAIEAANLGTFHIEPQTGKTTYSKRVMDWFGFTEMGLSMDVIPSYVHPDDRSKVMKALKKSYQSEETSHHDITYRVLNPIDGQTRYLRSFGKTYFTQEGKPNATIGTIQDITEQMTYQQQIETNEVNLLTKVEERTAALDIKNKELQRSNTNLEEFAYAASHDMKEPIRKIHFFADRLKARLLHKLEEEDLRYFERLETVARRMTTLIDDLLLYSHVSRGMATIEAVDLNQMLSFVLDDLELQIEEKGAQIEIGSLPTIQGRPRQLQQLFENLIANALKYSKEGVAPVVSVTSRLNKGSEASGHSLSINKDKTYHLIEVKDNGIGFEQADAERIFTVFTRLHGNAEYRGTGVGLSIVQKIVENHKGHIWAESQPGEGATFKVLLPAE
jgi:PAS domain S-box-containing protein